MTSAISAPRIYFLLAREAPVAVVLRRGPSNLVQMLKWDTKQDTFEKGQWLKGRVYEYRMDLSPSGKYVVYLAANFASKRKIDAWTAVSKPPFFTALLCYPNLGAIAGGGLFRSDTQVDVNCVGFSLDAMQSEPPPQGFEVRFVSFDEGWDDEPINHKRLVRDGWERREREVPSPALYYSKHSTLTEGGHILNRQLVGIGKKNEPWYLFNFSIADHQGKTLLELGNCESADLDSNGDVLFARDGKIWRLPAWQISKAGLSWEDAKLLIDLRDEKFEVIEPPDWAKEW